jgi:hypothetical protein
VILSSSSLVGSQKDHAVAVSHHDATPLTSGKLIHHLRGRNPAKCSNLPLLLGWCEFGGDLLAA